jgi:alpha-tubulin suppressor-like RCC1 family protein
MRIIYSLLALAACSSPSLTTINIDVSADSTWKVDKLHITIGTREAIPRPLESIEIVVPDEMAGTTTPIVVAGSSADVTVASGRVDVTPLLHDDVFYTLALQPQSCASGCMIGAKSCSATGVVTCDRQPNGCGAWSQPATCAAATPYCEEGACTATREIQITSGAFHSCAIRGNGTVACWGLNTSAQATPPSDVFKSIVAGWYYTCGIRIDNTITCWGEPQMKTNVPTGSFDRITAGAHHACAQRSDNTFACWGDSTLNRYGLTESRYLAIAAGSEHTCAIRIDGTLSCVGSNTYSQIAPGTTDKFVKLDAGDGHSCAMRANGTLWCWGYNVAIAGTPTGAFDSFALGSSNNCAIAGGAVTCWGNNQYGQSTVSPGQYRSVASGAWHTCALRTDKTLACWGANGDGQSTPPAL